MWTKCCKLVQQWPNIWRPVSGGRQMRQQRPIQEIIGATRPDRRHNRCARSMRNFTPSLAGGLIGGARTMKHIDETFELVDLVLSRLANEANLFWSCLVDSLGGIFVAKECSADRSKPNRSHTLRRHIELNEFREPTGRRSTVK